MSLRPALLALLVPTLLPMSAHAARPFDVRDLATLERVSSPALAPDGSRVVFAVRQVDYAANKSRTGLWIEDLRARDAAPPKRLTAEDMNVNTPAFSPDGRTVYFLSAKSGSMQLWSQPVAGGDAMQVSDFPLDVGGYKLAPDGKAIALSFETFGDCPDLTCTRSRLDARAADKASGRVYDRVFVRHWDTWADGRQNQLYYARFGADGKLAGEPAKLSRGIDGDIPSKPFGDMSDVAFAPDGASVVFSVRIAGKTEPWSTNFDLYQVAVDSEAAPKNLTAANQAWDAGPAFSPDGKTLYYRAMKRPGFEADRFALMAMDLATGATRELDPRWDVSADSIVVSADGKRLYVQAEELGQHPLFASIWRRASPTRVAGDGTVAEFDLAGDTLAFVRNTMKSPGQLFVARPDGRHARKVSTNNDAVLADIAFGDFEQFAFPAGTTRPCTATWSSRPTTRKARSTRSHS